MPVLNVLQVTIAKVPVEDPLLHKNAQLDISVQKAHLTMRLLLNYL